MKIIIVGYGRVGRRTVAALVGKGHEITVIDRETTRLGRAVDFHEVKLIRGNGIDVDVQRLAGVDRADLLLAVTREDNVNLMAAQVARTIFKVPRAIARVYEPSHGEVSIDPQMITVCPTVYTSEAIVNWVDELSGAQVHREQVVLPPAEPSGLRTKFDESKFILVVGGGKVGVNLVRSLVESGHEVALIELDAAQASRLATQLDCPIIVGDGTLGPILEEAGAPRARVFVAVTGKDQDNLIACQLAKRLYNIPKTIARISNPKNEPVVQRLGVDSTVSSTAIIEQVIERELPTIKIRTLLHLHGDKAQIIEYLLDEKSAAAGRALKDIAFPPDCNIVAVERDSELIIPRGDTRLEAGDMVIALVTVERESELRQVLVS
jgi:trk system potassium uptake protein TrkA